MFPDPELTPLLLKYGVTWADFSRKGRPPKNLPHLQEARRKIVTDLHLRGVTWVEMVRITGLSNGAIQRLTRGMWNPASRQNSIDNARRVGASAKGVKKPWLSYRMLQAWAAGTFDFHKGRARSDLEKLHLRASHTSASRAATSERLRRLWGDPAYRANLLRYHRRSDVRRQRSIAQAQRMSDHPTIRGICGYMTTRKGPARAWFRSSYEKAAMIMLDEDRTVESYEVEPTLVVGNRRILPDFLVTYSDGRRVLVEVKASWVLNLPSEHRTRQRLTLAQEEANHHGWGFEIWTEKDRLQHVVG